MKYYGGLILIPLLLTGGSSAFATNVAPFFSISILFPATCPARNSYAPYLSDALSQIGINVDVVEVGWDIIGPRTFMNPVTNGYIPTYADGGYDLLPVGVLGDIDYDPYYLYSNTQLIPVGSNFARYNNQTVSEWIDEYHEDYDADSREALAHKIQEAIAYQIPYIPLFHPSNIWAYSPELQISDDQLLLLSAGELSDGWTHLSVDNRSLTYIQPYQIEESTGFGTDDYISSLYLSPILIGLFTRDEVTHSLQPLIASAMPTWDATKTTAVVPLKHNVTFSNGHNLTAVDVVNTYLMHLTPAANSPIFDQLQWALYKDSSVGYNNSISALDNYTVQFKFAHADYENYNTMNLGIYDHQIIGTPEHPAVANYDFNSDPLNWIIGAGPYYLHTFIPDINVKNDLVSRVELVGRNDYWNGNSHFGNLSFITYNNKEGAIATLKNGTTAIIDANMMLYLDDVQTTGISYSTVTSFGTQFISVNMDHPILGTGISTPLGRTDPSKASVAANYVRLAISHAISRANLVSSLALYSAIPATSLWSPAANNYNMQIQLHSYNQTLAAEYMKLAGYSHSTTSTQPVPLAGSIFAFVIILQFKRKHS